jgi:ATP-dependent RNA helicase RhlE
MTFGDLGLCESVLRAVTQEGYTTPTPIQAEAIPHLIAGRDVLGSAQTGTGKTAAFALPLLHRLANPSPDARRTPHTKVLILSPTRELALQIHDSLRCYGRHLRLRSTVVMGGVGQEPQVRALQRGVDILIATPGRLCDLMNQGYVHLDHVEAFVLDEADRMLDMGFLPDVRRVIAKLPKTRQTALFSATMPPAIAELASSILRDPVRVKIAAAKDTTALIHQAVCFVPHEHKVKLLASLLTTEATGRVIVFTRTKRGADRVAEQLRRVDIAAEAIHGNKSQGARRRILDSFKSKRPPILVATDLAARGIDVDDVSHVFNFDLPDEAETYVHRIGRTGRAGAEGKTMAFCGGDERQQLAAIERLIKFKLPIYRDEEIEALPRSPKAAPTEPRFRDNNRSRSRNGGQRSTKGDVPPARPAAQRPAGGQRPSGGQRPAGTQRPAGGQKPKRYARKALSL